jgi:hypothetical protein
MAILFCLGIALSSCFGGKDLPGENNSSQNTEIVENGEQTSSSGSINTELNTELFGPKIGTSATTCATDGEHISGLPVLEPTEYIGNLAPILQISQKNILSYTQVNTPVGFKLYMVGGATITVKLTSAMKSGDMTFIVTNIEAAGDSNCFTYEVGQVIGYRTEQVQYDLNTFNTDSQITIGQLDQDIIKKYFNTTNTCPTSDSHLAANTFYFQNYANIDTASAKYTFTIKNLNGYQKWSSSSFASLTFTDGTKVQVIVANSSKSGHIRFIIKEILETGSCFNLQPQDVIEYQPEPLTYNTVYNK